MPIVSFMGIVSLAFIVLFAYLVIRVAVRHGIDSSKTYQLIKEIKNKDNDVY